MPAAIDAALYRDPAPGKDPARGLAPAGAGTCAGAGDHGWDYPGSTMSPSSLVLVASCALVASGAVVVEAGGQPPINPDANVITLAGSAKAGFADGLGTAAAFNNPEGLAIDGQGTVYVADSNNKRIRKILPDGTVSTFAGNDSGQAIDGQGTSASFNDPTAVTVGADGNFYVADHDNGLVRKIAPQVTAG